MVKRDAPFGPPVLTVPTLGIASSVGPAEVVRGRGRRMVAASEKVVEQDELLPASAVVGDDKKRTPGLAIRVRGLRTR
jgi:hypothetical protein